MVGRPKKPSNLKILNGTARPDRMAKNEPKPKPIAPACPSWMDSTAKKEWKRVAKTLEELGLLTQLDMASLAAYCQSYAVYVHAQKIANDYYKEHGRYTTSYTNKSGAENQVSIPEIAICEKALKQMKMFANDFGLSPSARARISLPGEKEDDEFELYLMSKPRK